MGENSAANTVAGHPDNPVNDGLDHLRFADHHYKPSRWMSSNCSGRFDHPQRITNNPYCGISTDAYGRLVSDPTRRYGHPELYDRWASGGGSQNLLIEDVQISGFVAAIAVSPAGAAQNDTIRIKRCWLRENAYGITLGTSQARACHIEENLIERCHTAIDNVTFSAVDQSAPGATTVNCSSNQYTGCRNLYNLLNVTGQSHISGEYAEFVINLGHFGTGGGTTQTNHIAFTGCYYNFGALVKTHHLLASVGALTFTGCKFVFGGEPYASQDLFLQLTSAGSKVVFQSCHFTSGTDRFTNFYPTLYSEWSALRFRDCSRQHSGGTSRALSDDVHTGLPQTPTRIPLHRTAQTLRISGGYIGPNRVSLLRHKVSPYPVFVLPVVQKSRFELEITQDHEGSFLPGDRIYCDYEVLEHSSAANAHLPLPLLVVTSVAGAVVTAEIPQEYRYEVRLVQDVVAGRTGVPLRLHPRELNGPYVILQGEVRGTFVQGSKQVSSVSNPSLLQPGDLVNGDFTREGTRIVTINNDAVTLSQAALQSSADPQGDPIPAILAT